MTDKLHEEISKMFSDNIETISKLTWDNLHLKNRLVWVVIALMLSAGFNILHIINYIN